MMAAQMPDATGESTHDTTIALTPLTHGKLSKVHSSTGSFQTTHSEPRDIMVMPTMPPTHVRAQPARVAAGHLSRRGLALRCPMLMAAV